MFLHWWFLIPGVAVIILGFIGFVGVDAPWTPMHWMTLVVALTVFLVDFATFALAFKGNRKSFNKAIPGLGILWFATTTYTILAIGGMVAAWLLSLNLLSAIAFQLAILTALLVAIQVSRSAGGHAVKVQAEESKALQYIEALRFETRRTGVRIGSLVNVIPDIQAQWTRIEDDVRYMAPIESDDATSLEQKMIELVRDIDSEAQASGSGIVSVDADRIAGCMAELKELLRLRKGMLTASDSSGYEVCK